MSNQSFLPFEPSGESNFTLTTSEIIENALDILQVGSDGEDVEPEVYSRSLDQLNLCIKEMQTNGLSIATYRTAFLFLVQGQYEYIVEDSEVTNEYFQTTLSADVVSPTTTIPLTDISNYEVGDRIGIYKNDGNLFWSTVDSITPTVSPAGDVEIADSIDGDADEGCDVLNYKEKASITDRVWKTMRRDNLNTDIPITQLSRDEYENLPFKEEQSGTISQAYYWRARDKGRFFLWQPPQDSRQILRFTYEKKIDDMIRPTDALDMDDVYLPYIVQHLAYRMCNRLGISSEIYQRVKEEFYEIRDSALTYDSEVTDFKITLQRNQ